MTQLKKTNHQEVTDTPPDKTIAEQSPVNLTPLSTVVYENTQEANSERGTTTEPILHVIQLLEEKREIRPISLGTVTAYSTSDTPTTAATATTKAITAASTTAITTVSTETATEKPTDRIIATTLPTTPRLTTKDQEIDSSAEQDDFFTPPKDRDPRLTTVQELVAFRMGNLNSPFNQVKYELLVNLVQDIVTKFYSAENKNTEDYIDEQHMDEQQAGEYHLNKKHTDEYLDLLWQKICQLDTDPEFYELCANVYAHERTAIPQLVYDPHVLTVLPPLHFAQQPIQASFLPQITNSPAVQVKNTNLLDLSDQAANSVTFSSQVTPSSIDVKVKKIQAEQVWSEEVSNLTQQIVAKDSALSSVTPNSTETDDALEETSNSSNLPTINDCMISNYSPELLNSLQSTSDSEHDLSCKDVYHEEQSLASKQGGQKKLNKQEQIGDVSFGKEVPDPLAIAYKEEQISLWKQRYLFLEQRAIATAQRLEEEPLVRYMNIVDNLQQLWQDLHFSNLYQENLAPRRHHLLNQVLNNDFSFSSFMQESKALFMGKLLQQLLSKRHLKPQASNHVAQQMQQAVADYQALLAIDPQRWQLFSHAMQREFFKHDFNEVSPRLIRSLYQIKDNKEACWEHKLTSLMLRWQLFEKFIQQEKRKQLKDIAEVDGNTVV